MNPKLLKVYNEIEKTRAKIAELQGILPGLEQQKTELENLEFIRLIRSANILPVNLSAFIDEYKAGMTRQTAEPPGSGIAAVSRGKEDELLNETE